MEITKASYLKTAMDFKDFPTNGWTEIALTGRSNVGKSSFINSVCNNSKLARTSKTAGKTVTLNFYSINDSFYFVDMPGYGFAARERDILYNFSKATDKYVAEREELKGFIMIVDSRVITNDDIEMKNYLVSRDMNFIVIMSKIDKLKRNDIRKRRMETAKILGIDEKNVVPYSSLTKENLPLVLEKLESLIESTLD